MPGIIDSNTYQEILRRNGLSSVVKLDCGENWIFCQDDDPEQASKSSQSLVKESVVEFPYSDFSPIDL